MKAFEVRLIEASGGCLEELSSAQSVAYEFLTNMWKTQLVTREILKNE